MRMIVAALCLITTYSGMAAQPRGGEEPPPAALQIQASLFEKAVACIKEHEGWHGNHLPYVGYGHNYPNFDIILTLYCKQLKYSE